MWALPELLNATRGDPSALRRAALHVFSAAPATSAQENGGDPAVQLGIAEALVIPQYRAIAQLAAIRSRLTRAPVNVHLTLVGGGVFNNDPRVLQRALDEVARVVNGEALTVYSRFFA